MSSSFYLQYIVVVWISWLKEDIYFNDFNMYVLADVIVSLQIDE